MKFRSRIIKEKGNGSDELRNEDNKKRSGHLK